jgi:hypothetical protein
MVPTSLTARWRRWALCAGLLAATTVPLATAGAPADASGLLGTPGCARTQLTGVSLDSAQDGWAVGYHFEGSYRAFALHWDGTRWSRADVPVLGAESYLYAVNAFSPSEAFAVGTYRVGDQFRTLILSWDGQTWKRLPSASPNARSNDLYGVSILSAKDAWAVGAYGWVGANTLALHWDGSTWKRVSSPNPTDFDFLQSVDGASSDDVWAVGASDPGTLTLHWDGSTWKRVSSPGSGSVDILFGVTAIGGTDAWSVGRLDYYQAKTLTEHWDGTGWEQVKTASPGHRYNAFNGVDAVSSDDVWAVGTYRDHGVTFGLAAHWDGSSWQGFTIPGRNRSLDGVSAVSTDDVWAVGHRRSPFCLIEHWDGSAWSRWEQ